MSHHPSPAGIRPATREQLAEDVKQIVAQHSTLAAEAIQESHTLDHDLALDSLDRVELVMELEEEFDIHVPDDVADKVQTVGDIIAGVAAILEVGGE